MSDRSSSLVYGKRQEPSKTEESPREIIGVRDKSTCEEASENEAAMQAAKRPVLRPSSASAGRRQEKINLVGAERMQRPQSASGQPRLHGGVRHAEFFRPSSSGASRRDQGDECSPEQQEFLRRLLAASATHRRGVPSMYNFGKVIGVGSFGTVRLGYHKLTGHRVAIKTYERAKMKDPQQWKRVQQEARVMEKLSDFPPVCRFLEAFETASPRKAHLIMEHLGGGSLCSYVKSKRKLTEAQVQPLMFQVAVALEHMHSLDVVHRDIKLENILFSDNSHRIVRIIDFGFSTRCAADRRLRLFCGTPSYMAPEIVRRHEYRGKPIDLWSFGVVVYACLSGHFPFAAKSQPDLYRKILRGTFHLPDGLSDGAAALIQAAILVDVNRRIAAPELRRHFWLTSGVSESDLRAGTKIGSHTRSKHPKDDFHAELLNRMTETMGVPRDTVVNGIMRAEHSPITACYYLLMGMRRNDNVIDSNTEDAPGQNKISSPTHTVVAAA